MAPTLRPARIWAIAARDLRSELKGRAGLGLPIISLALLLPMALVGQPPSAVDEIQVRGQVPAEVLALPHVVEAPLAGTGFWNVDGVLLVYDWRIPPVIREALDGPSPAVVVEEFQPPSRRPGRTLLLALVSASTLTGSVSGSIAGERSRHTLQALLCAAVTRLEIVLGKWLAWTAFGTTGALVASAAAMLGGHASPGLWLFAMPLVPASTVALGLYLVRRTTDVVSGTSVSLRVMPAVLGGTGLFAWVLSTFSDSAAALVPIGGALLLAGNQWEGDWLAPLLAIIATTALTAWLLVATSRDLEQRPDPTSLTSKGLWAAFTDSATAAALWWALIPGPVLWGWSGNAAMTESLRPERGLLAGTAVLALMALVRAAGTPSRAEHPPNRRPDVTLLAVPVLLGLATLLPLAPPANHWMALAAARLNGALHPTGWLALLAIPAQEYWYRGWLQTRAGPVAAGLVWVVVMSPFDPVFGIVSALALGWTAHRSGWVAAALARGLLALAGW